MGAKRAIQVKESGDSASEKQKITPELYYNPEVTS